MVSIIGIVVVFAMVFGGYALAGGKFGIIVKALPFEMMMIGGAALGAFLIANSGAAAKGVLKDIGGVFKGPRWKPDDYRDLLCLLFELIRIARQNPIELEEHIEGPETSAIFQRYPRILKDHEAVDLICDTMRSATMNYDDPNQVEEVLDKRMEVNQHHALHTSHALQTVADGLPALGIVAAVLGVIKTMGSVGQPPAVLGAMIGSALVGTFLGILLAYAFAEPLAGLLEQKVDEAGKELQCIKTTLLASMQGYAPQVAVEFGRKVLYSTERPTFAELEKHVKGKK